jgi:hypothetical protein
MPKYDTEQVRAAVRRTWRHGFRRPHAGWSRSALHEYAHEAGLPHDCVLPAASTDPRVMTARQLWAVARRTYGSVRCRYGSVVNILDIRGLVASVYIGTEKIGIFEDFDDECYESRGGRRWIVEWADPAMGEKVADAISQLSGRWGLEPFPADWMETEVACR